MNTRSTFSLLMSMLLSPCFFAQCDNTLTPTPTLTHIYHFNPLHSSQY